MAKNGRRHLLIVYKYMLDRWWKATLAIGISLLALAGGLGGLIRAAPVHIAALLPG
ncbi:MAG: hypothetical protein Q7U34_03835 [Anaerolineales bacterium]|nr:hypothetical protein [Anaerolineales bacterium]MDO9347744.1 hypothetical protein [Anaerolineales bacterium]